MILVTQKDAVAFIKKCLDSIAMQTYKNYIVPIMDDCSTDGTWEIVKTYPEPFIGIRNDPPQQFYIKNFIAGINAFSEDDDIIVFVSGDDYLYSDDVLAYLNEIYQDPDIWLTYGSFETLSAPWGKGFCKQITDTRTYRRSRQWFTSHLITCRKKLWKKLKDEDLRYVNGEYPNHSFDNAFMYPMLEMTGLKHVKFVEKTMYVYNDINPLNVINYQKDPGACMRERRYWSKQPMYDELTEL
jgi:glycosyltransferase involved in cell wall biosynthesis